MAGSDPDIKAAIKKALLDGAITGTSTEELRQRCGLTCTNKQFSRALGSLVYGTRREVSRESTDPRNPDAEKTIRLTPQGRESMTRG